MPRHKDISTKTKTCSKCGAICPWGDFRPKRSICKLCRHKKYVASYIPHGKDRNWPEGFKVCSRKTCTHGGKLQSLSAFRKDKRSTDGLISECKSCESVRNKAYRKANLEACRERAKKWDLANPSRRVELQRQQRLRDPQAFKQKTDTWYARNKHRVTAKARLKRRTDNATMRQKDRMNRLQMHRITEVWYENTLAEQNHGCAICGTKVSGLLNGRFVIDHNHACCRLGRSCDRCRRALLCVRCNTLLGHIERSWQVVQGCIDYLTEHPLRDVTPE